jgi:hypothetical protein
MTRGAIVTICEDAPIFRVTLPPGDRTGLSAVSQVTVDKVVSDRHRAALLAVALR